MTYINLFSKYPRYLSYGLLHSFFSGFGQTFFIALFVPFFRSEFSLSSESFGIMYSQATLVSAFLIPFIGPHIDNVNLKSFSYFTGLGIIIGCVVLGLSSTVVGLFIGLSIVRLMGQGLMSHITQTAISRFFDKTRGRALSISQLGFPLSEAIWPILATTVISHYDWRIGFFVMASLIGLVFFPLSYFLIDSKEKFSSGVVQVKVKGLFQNSRDLWRETLLLRHPFFYMILPFSILPPFLLTGVFISQSDIAQIKGWSMPTMASSFLGFAVFRLLFSFIAGPIVDRFTARRVLPFTLLPHMLGMFCLVVFNQTWAPLLSFVMFGIGVGAGTNVKSALWPEVFGVKHLGKIRSFIAPIAVVSTAIGPWAFGWYFSNYQSLNEMLQWSVSLMVAATCLVVLATVPPKVD